MPTIYLGKNNQYQTEVSDEDYTYLIQWKWNYKISRWANGHKVYARRGGGKQRSTGEINPTILMHNVILERMGLPRPSDVHTGDHADKDSLNNQRHNLRWASKSEQSKNQKPRTVTRPVVPSNGLESVPY